LLVVATIPTVVIVLIFKKFIEDSFEGNILIVCFLITAILLIIAEIVNKKSANLARSNNILSESNVLNYNISYKQAIFIGIAQGVAAMPGISRSGTTISAGLIIGVSKNEVAQFSFLLSIPIIIASMVYELFKLYSTNSFVSFNFSELAVGFIISFIVGLFCIKVMLNFVKKQRLYVFSIYLVMLIMLLVLNNYFRFLF
jgi:undecaprenyl-diphosphatase